MKVYFPSYYNKFKCIAEKCRHSCCVGWEISVDEDTLAGYSALGESDRAEILSHIGADGCITLADGERCPFLRYDGLCRIIADHGEEHTSRICREHPRFYHRVGNRVEGGIGASCEEAARIILSCDDFADFIALERDVEVADETNFDSLTHRSRLYDILSSQNYAQAIETIRAEYSLPDHFTLVDEWNETLCGLEYLDDSHRDVIMLVGREEREEVQEYIKRFLAYLIFRHVSIAEHYDGLRASVGFCLLLAGVMEGMTSSLSLGLESAAECARIISEEIEYSEDNTASLIFELECQI